MSGRPGPISGQPGWGWAEYLAALIEEVGTLTAVAWKLFEDGGGDDDVGSIERALRRLRARGQRDGGAWGQRLLSRFGMPRSIEDRLVWMGVYHSLFNDLPVASWASSCARAPRSGRPRAPCSGGPARAPPGWATRSSPAASSAPRPSSGSPTRPAEPVDPPRDPGHAIEMAVARSLCVTPRLVATDLACRSGRSGEGPPRGGERTHLVLVRRGAFGAHLGSRRYLADPRTALVSWEGTEYRISHPGDRGDDCTVFELEPALSDELLRGMRPRIDLELWLEPALQVAHAGFLALVRRGEDELAREEAALELVAAVLSRSPRHRPDHDPGRRAVALAAAELLNRDLAANRAVSAMADEIGCSPGHLMRSFRAVTGATLRGYRLRLRLAAAVDRLAAGDRDLTRLAVELGFASHAHLTDTCARLLGVPPRELRARLAGPARRLRTFLEAAPRRRA